MQEDKLNQDKFDLERFVFQQEDSYQFALSEIKAGKKSSHWMWFIFPQIDGLGYSSMARRYSIKSLDEAKAYLEHPILGPRLKECAEALMEIEGKTAEEIFGFPDVLKLKSSMTLFEKAVGENSVFSSVLEKYFNGTRDSLTLDILNRQS
mgnify:CR=1 FL=1|jgi:Uncharacterized conserved protein